MKKQLFFLFFLSTFAAKAQSDIHPSRWQIGLHGSQSSLRNIVEQSSIQSFEIYNIPSRQLINYGFSFGAEFVTTNWLTLRLQAKYNNQRYKTVLESNAIITDIYSISGLSVVKFNIEDTHAYHYLSASIGLSLNIPNYSRFYVGMSANPSFELFKTVQTKLKYPDGNVKKDYLDIEHSKAGFAPTYFQAFVGYRQPLSNTYMLSIEPFWEYSNKLFTLDSDGSTAKFSNIGVSLYFSKNSKSAEKPKTGI
jgi:hypothetical protein